MTLSKTITATILTALLTAAPAIADAHKPGCKGLPDATKHSNSACED